MKQRTPEAVAIKIGQGKNALEMVCFSEDASCNGSYCKSCSELKECPHKIELQEIRRSYRSVLVTDCNYFKSK